MVINLSNFIKKVVMNSGSLIITLPRDIVELYEINPGDILELDLVRNHHDNDKKVKRKK
ncbi:hypothetical protein LCGC14_1061270 [marine sediment metagenome]|uniref:SpoVT-AbrB domain-containing protein n=1 Tax=marine sediment metagenome TaxID=412755 RepID=A0A0F9QRY0_9ZZZZ